MTIIDNGKEYTIKRTQKKDSIDSKDSKVKYSDPDFERIIKACSKEEIFYAHHFCDINKSINIQAKKSRDIADLFSEFIKNYDKEKGFAYNLEIFSEDVQRKIDSTITQKGKIDNKIKNNEELLKDSMAQITPYPNMKIYEDEETDMSKFSEELLDLQLSKVYMCAKIKACDLLEKEQRNIDNQNNIKTLEKLKKIYNEKKAYIIKSNEYGGIIAVQIKLDELKKIRNNYSDIINKITVANLSRYVVELFKANDDCFTMDYYKQVAEQIKEKNNYVSELKKEVDNLVKGNNIIDLMSSLISKKDELLNYRNTYRTHSDTVKCPVCGSEKFGAVVDSDLLKEAESIVGINKDSISKKKSEIDNVNAEIKKLNDELLKNAKAVIEEYLEKTNNIIKELDNINDETKEFFNELKKLKNTSTLENNIDEKFLEERIIQIKDLILIPEEINRIQREYSDFLKITDFGFDETENIESIIKRLKTQLDPKIKIAEKVEKELLIKKVNSIKSFKGNYKHIKLVEDSNKLKEDLQRESEKEKYLNELKKKSDNLAKRIRQLISRLERNEFDSVGPVLRLIYKKLIRIDNIKNIELKYEEDKLLILDEKKKNIVNILSNGQLSVFMLAYFFAGIFSRTDELIKIYFIDDLTACMDDINMLSFLDLIKYQMRDDNYIEQLFFSSCDEKICKLLKYKLDGCGIKWCEINEKKFVESEGDSIMA